METNIMVMNQQQTDSQPTVEFEEHCNNIITSWRNGTLPFNEALAQLSMCKQESLNSNQIANQARAEHLLGNVQHYRGNLGTSIQHWERARKIYEKVGNKKRVAAIDLNLGESYRFKGEFTRALGLYRSAQKSAQELNDIKVQTIAFANEGLVLISLNQHDYALEALETGIELSEQWDADDTTLPMLLCEVHHGMATIYMHKEDNDTAWEHALRTLEIAEIVDQPFQRGFANRIMGKVMTELEVSPNLQFSSDPDTYFRAALESFREINAEAELARTMFTHAYSLSARGRRNSAARKLQQVMIIFTRLGMLDDAARAAKSQLDIM
jgi:tetratricopeptide (TPR) repeat protein